ncbi:TrbI/VirB10 family protein [Sphingosinicella sp. CPCC 101087]|uniref:TrbI/VirB10 family protein n=1 Tax=Sphingosinicella sp. CPCC 101087 TaxID=2497754 RepID=UPI00101C5598|nr:TrbI/VirB10 family protein [Sphingosinicella sp. CPCC 101087]
MSDAMRGGGPPAAPAKADPEALALRGSPRPVVRFRRGLIIGIIASGAALLITVAWLALEPPSFRISSAEEEGAEPLRSGAPEALAAAPSSYGEVPKLGPPLPGDLGRPILEHQRSLEDSVQANAAAEAERARAAAEAALQRREAARASGLLVPLSGRTRPEAVESPLRKEPGSSAVSPISPAPTEDEPPQHHDAQMSGSAPGDAATHPILPAPSRWTLSAGTIIPASLITGLNSDLAGTMIAQVTEPVRDSATGRTVLVPQGARLIGSYDSVVAYGQRRAMILWQRIVLPDGSSIRLDNVPATDLAGYAGLEDEVDFHTWRLLKGVALSTLLGVGTELSFGGGEGDLVRAIRESTQQNAARAGDQITSRNLDVQPTLTVRPGWPLRAVLHEDLVLRPWRG